MRRKGSLAWIIHQTWTNLNVRCGGNGKYYRESRRNHCYANVYIRFTKVEFREWCTVRASTIMGLQRPSIDRIDSNLDYTLDNIQFIELADNIAKEKLTIHPELGYGICSTCANTKPIEVFCRSSRARTGYINRCKPCYNADRLRRAHKQRSTGV